MTPLLTALRAVARAESGTAAPSGGDADVPEDVDVPERADAPDDADAPEDIDVPEDADPQAAPWLDTETALTLLASPLASMDAADLRRLGRALREEERAAGNHVPQPSDELLTRARAEPERIVAHDPA
ncbi:DNA helicase UvrD, partial [Streptomyces sp. NPDC127044]